MSTSSRFVPVVLVLLASHVAVLGAVAQPMSSPDRVVVHDVRSASIADQLGARLSPGQCGDMELGISISAVLADVLKLAKLGIPDARSGARVTAFRSAPDKVIVEVDEVVPSPRTRRTILKLDENGRLVAAPHVMQVARANRTM